MNTLHAAGIMHKGISIAHHLETTLMTSPAGLNLKCIGLAPRDSYGPNKLIKIFNVCYHTCLLALHRSNNIGFAGDPQVEDMQVPEGW